MYFLIYPYYYIFVILNMFYILKVHETSTTQLLLLSMHPMSMVAVIWKRINSERKLEVIKHTEALMKWQNQNIELPSMWYG